MKLRPYQERAITNIRDSFRRGNKRTILQLATAGGKTLLSSYIIKQAIEKNNRVVVFVPRRELAYQFHSTLKRVGVDAGIIMAGETRSASNVQVASFDTFESWAMRKGNMIAPQADLIIIDEAHVYLDKQIRIIESEYSNAHVIGLTATPARKSGLGLGNFYQDMVLGVSIKELTDQGFLAPVRYYAPPLDIDLDKVKLNTSGDYQDSELDKVMDDAKLIGDIVENWARIAGDRQTVVFCSGINHSVHVCNEFKKYGIKAEHLDGKTEPEERKRILERLSSGETQVLTNVFVATYGLDIPSLSCAVMARPTKNLALYLQMVGRVMRICEGKEDAIIIDHAGVVKENGMVTDEQPWSLDVKEKIKDRKEKNKKEKKEKKDITCSACGFVYKAERECPYCGHQWELWGKELPYYEVELVEVGEDPKKNNREASWGYKTDFAASLRMFCMVKGFKDGWWKHKYREKFGVWPNDKRVRDVKPSNKLEVEVRNWITHMNIKNAKRREKGNKNDINE
ncbi:MAG: DEAD/DEAH box helicase [Bacteroides sp.]